MPTENVDTLIIGGGQAGLAMSEHLSKRGVSHLVVERNRIAERWRSERWDSLVANGPAWHDRFPTLNFDDISPDSFAHRDRIVAYFEAFAKHINAPIRCGVEVTSVTPKADGTGYHVDEVLLVEAERLLVVDIAGDGSFEMTLQELSTAQAYGLPVKVVILNNGFLGMVRDHDSLLATTYADRLPHDLSDRTVFVLDPMLATGGTLVAAIDLMLERGARNITAICLLAAPEGVKMLEVPLWRSYLAGCILLGIAPCTAM